jgi:hypothetical protein
MHPFLFAAIVHFRVAHLTWLDESYQLFVGQAFSTLPSSWLIVNPGCVAGAYDGREYFRAVLLKSWIVRL